MRLMVVDDSVQIRNGICRGIEWRKYGIDDIQACSNGKEALEKMRTFHPDIVVADIRMPEMDGIELLHQIRKEDIRCKYILLTAFPEFEYAQKAIHYGADDYILKPVRPDSLIQTVSRYAKEAAHEKKEAKQAMELFERNFVQCLQEGSALPEAAKISGFFREKYGIDMIRRPFLMGVVRAENLAADSEELNQRLKLLQGELNGAVLMDAGTGIWVLAAEGSHSEAENHARFTEICRQVKRNNRNCTSPDTVLSAYIVLVQHAEELQRQFCKAVTEMNRDFYGEPGVCRYGAASAGEEVWCSELPAEIQNRRWTHEILKTFKKEDQKDIEDVFLTFLAVMKERRVSPEIFRNYMRYMYAVCFQELKLADAGQGGVLIDNFLHASALVEKLMNYLIYKSSDNSEDIHVSPMIRQICQYLKKNYAAQVSVETAAESVHKTANYISMRFKKEMGISFSEYLTDIRINRAVELLTSTNQSVQQVAERCGFGNYVYFSKILKQKTGKNATEIRKNKN